MQTLISFLKKVNDPRQTSGKRHPLWLILLLVIMGFMLGYPDQVNIFTLDALHCQKETTTLITESKNDYVIAPINRRS